jgi:hypothetical protein
MSTIEQVVRAIELNERFQFITLSAERSTDLLQRIGEAALPVLVDRGELWTADIAWVSSYQEAVQHVLYPHASLTIYDAFGRDQLEAVDFMRGINANRDTMGLTATPSTLLLRYPVEFAAHLSRFADIWSCRQHHHVGMA